MIRCEGTQTENVHKIVVLDTWSTSKFNSDCRERDKEKKTDKFGVVVMLWPGARRKRRTHTEPKQRITHIYKLQADKIGEQLKNLEMILISIKCEWPK